MRAAELIAAYATGERNFVDVRILGEPLTSKDYIDLGIPDLDLAGLQLPDADLNRVDLVGVNLSRAEIRCANLSGANLSGANLSGANLSGADLSNADLSGANLRGAVLSGADLNGADLNGADLSGAVITNAKLQGANLHAASLVRADLTDANLTGANLTQSHLGLAELHRAHLDGANLGDVRLHGANLHDARLVRCDLRGAKLSETVFVDLDLSSLCSVGDLQHHAPSRVDWSAIAKSYRHPRLKQFMVDCGVPALVAEYMIDCVRALGEVNIRAMLQSTFISYGGPDESFARKLYEALRAAGVVTFFFPETAKPGERLHREMYRGVNEYDRILLVCSRASLTRPGVLNEIEETFAREAKQGGATYLLPITLDDFVFTDWKKSHEHLAERMLQRVVADFRGADTDDAKFQAALARVIDALKVKPVPSSLPPVVAGTGGGTP